MHDVGKIGIPDAILLKPGKHTADEWAIMKEHTRIGADIIGDHPSPLMTMSKTIALSHHEKWDGSGYPYGISGDDIPIAARIVAIADVFDALTSIRPYKRAWPIEDAVKEVLRSSGSHFDPEVVSAFYHALQDILDAKYDIEQNAHVYDSSFRKDILKNKGVV
jgi:putative two-component system response regulator